MTNRPETTINGPHKDYTAAAESNRIKTKFKTTSSFLKVVIDIVRYYSYRWRWRAVRGGDVTSDGHVSILDSDVQQACNYSAPNFPTDDFHITYRITVLYTDTQAHTTRITTLLQHIRQVQRVLFDRFVG